MNRSLTNTNDWASGASSILPAPFAAFSFCFFNFLLRVCKSSSSLISDSEDEASFASFAKTESARKPLSVFTPSGRTYFTAILFSRIFFFASFNAS